MSEVDAKVEGLKEFYAKLDQIGRDVAGSPMGAAMGRATLLVTRSARLNAPVDRGPLRASIVPQVVIRDKIVSGAVGSNREYAPYMELGTRPFWPPWKPIYEWALRKMRGDKEAAGALAQGARLAIAARGIQAKKFLQRALVDNAERIYRIIGDTVGRIVRK
jgi:HK97 gp10 family phage protein